MTSGIRSVAGLGRLESSAWALEAIIDVLENGVPVLWCRHERGHADGAGSTRFVVTVDGDSGEFGDSLCQWPAPPARIHQLGRKVRSMVRARSGNPLGLSIDAGRPSVAHIAIAVPADIVNRSEHAAERNQVLLVIHLKSPKVCRPPRIVWIRIGGRGGKKIVSQCCG